MAVNTPILATPLLVLGGVFLIIFLMPYITKLLRLPSVVGFIIAGMLAGSNGFGIFSNKIPLDLLSTTGLLYIMFMAGLELDLDNFIRNRRKSYVFGLFTFAVPMLIGYVVCKYLLHYQQITALLTSSMFATHTLVAYPIISHYNIVRKQTVVITIGGTILTDTAVLILLSILDKAHQNALSGTFFLKLLIGIIIFTVLAFWLLPKIGVWFLKKIQEENSRFIFVLTILFIYAIIAQAAGIEPITGAFAAGLAYNNMVRKSPVLMDKTAFVGKSIFIPIFLLNVGMIVDPKVLFTSTQAMFTALILTIVALFGKWAAAFLTQKTFNYSATERQLIFGLSSSHAAATLAIILLGYKSGIVNENILNGTIILILFTCLTASFVTENASRKIASLDKAGGK